MQSPCQLEVVASPCPHVSLFLSLSLSGSVPCPCPPLSLSLSLSVCVPVPVRLCPCPCPSVSLSLSVCVPVPIHLCPYPCPSVSQYLSVCVPVHLCVCPLASLSLCVPVPIRLYRCCVLFQRISLATDNFQCLFYCQKNQRVTFIVTFVANRQHSARITQGRPATDDFQRFFRPIQRTKSTEVTF
jgi:hypothetical protein